MILARRVARNRSRIMSHIAVTKKNQKQLITSCQPKYTKAWCYWVLLHLYLHSPHASYDSSRPLRSKALEGHQIEDSSPTCAVLLIHRHAMSCIPENGRFCRSLHFHRWRVAGRDQMISLRMLDHFGPWTAVHLEHAEDTTLRNLVDEAPLWRCHTFAHFGSVSGFQGNHRSFWRRRKAPRRSAAVLKLWKEYVKISASLKETSSKLPNKSSETHSSESSNRETSAHTQKITKV